MAALVTLGASPAYAASKKAGRITQGESVTLLNTSGFARVTLDCGLLGVRLNIVAQGSADIDAWTDVRSTSFTHTHGTDHDEDMEKPDHVEWSVSRGTKVALGEVYVADTSTGNDCLYTSLIS